MRKTVAARGLLHNARVKRSHCRPPPTWVATTLVIYPSCLRFVNTICDNPTRDERENCKKRHCSVVINSLLVYKHENYQRSCETVREADTIGL